MPPEPGAQYPAAWGRGSDHATRPRPPIRQGHWASPEKLERGERAEQQDQHAPLANGEIAGHEVDLVFETHDCARDLVFEARDFAAHLDTQVLNFVSDGAQIILCRNAIAQSLVERLGLRARLRLVETGGFQPVDVDEL